MSDRDKGRGGGFRRRKRGSTRRDLQTMEVAPAEWAEIPVSEVGTRVWGEGLDQQEADPEGAARADSESAELSEEVLRAPLRHIEDRITSQIRERMDNLAAERRVILDGVRRAIVSLKDVFNQRLDEVLARQSPVGGAPVPEELVDQLPRLTEAISRDRDELRERVEEVQADLGGQVQAIAQDLGSRIERLTRTVEGLSASDGPEEPDVAAELGALRAAQAASSDRIDALTEVLEGLRDAVSRPADGEQLDRLARGVEALKAKLGAAADGRRLDQLTMSVEALQARLTSPREGRRIDRLTEAVEEVKARLDSADLALVGDLAKAVEGLRMGLQAAVGGKADLKDLRAAVSAQRRQEKATTDLRERIAVLSKALEAYGKPRAAPRLSVEVQTLLRRVEAIERAVPRKLSGALDRKIKPLQETVESGIEEVRAELRPLQELAKAIRASRRSASSKSTAHGESPAPSEPPAQPDGAEDPAAAVPLEPAELLPQEPAEPTAPGPEAAKPRRGLFRRGR